MKKILLIIEREYSTRVKKKSFLLLTILVPLIIMGFYAAIIAISITGGTESETVAVIDKGHVFDEKIANSGGIKFELIKNETEDSFRTKYIGKGYNLFLAIPESDTVRPNLYYARSIGPATQGRIEAVFNAAIKKKRLIQANIPEEKLKSLDSDLTANTLKGAGEKTQVNAGMNASVGFIGGFLIYFVLFIYGSQVMRGVMEEKTSRIAEVIISSAKPFQLMLGKILGIGAVGLTQFAIWIFLVIGLQYVLPYIFPSLAHAMSQPSSTPGAGGMTGIIMQLRSLPIGHILFGFLFYFLGGYLLYAALFASVGSVVNDDPQEAQQLMFPIMMPIILSFVIMAQAINQPNSNLAIFGSLFPLTSPIVMMGRLPYGVPDWQLAASMLFLILGFLGTTWMAGRIYRTGILLYGKKVTLKEMFRWAFRRS